MRAMTKMSPAILFGLAIAMTNNAYAGPQSLLDPYYRIQPEKPLKVAQKAKGKKGAGKPATTKIDLSKLKEGTVPETSKSIATKSEKVETKKTAASEPKPKAKEVPQTKKAAIDPIEDETGAGVISGVRHIAKGVVITTKGAGVSIIHGAKYVGGHTYTGTKYIGHKAKSGALIVGDKVVDGTHVAGIKIKDGACAVGGKVKDGAQAVGPKAMAVPKVIGHGIKISAVKIKDGSVATGRKVADISQAAKDKVFDLMHPVGSQPVATAQMNAHGAQR